MTKGEQDRLDDIAAQLKAMDEARASAKRMGATGWVKLVGGILGIAMVLGALATGFFQTAAKAEAEHTRLDNRIEAQETASHKTDGAIEKIQAQVQETRDAVIYIKAKMEGND